MRDQLATLDPFDQLRLEPQHAVERQHVRHEVVGEHRKAIQVAERGDAGAGEIGAGDLGALEERDRQAVVGRRVRERLPASELGGQRDRGSSGTVDHAPEAPAELIADVRPEVTQRVRVQLHQLVAGVLAQCLRDLGRVDLRELLCRPWTARRKPLADAERDREVARAPFALAQRRKPPRAEVDRVQGQPECRALLAGPAEELGSGIRIRARLSEWEARGIAPDRLLHDRDVARQPRHARASAPNLINHVAIHIACKSPAPSLIRKRNA